MVQIKEGGTERFKPLYISETSLLLYPSSRQKFGMSITAFATAFKKSGRSIVTDNRTWEEFLELSALSLPSSFPDVTTRVRFNLNRFLSNYFQLLTFTIFLGLIYHPHSIIAFLLLFISWLFLYFAPLGPLRLCGFVIPDSAVLIVLVVATGLILAFTGVFVNVVISLAIGAVLVCLHSVFRRKIVRLVDLLNERPRRARLMASHRA